MKQVLHTHGIFLLFGFTYSNISNWINSYTGFPCMFTWNGWSDTTNTNLKGVFHGSYDSSSTQNDPYECCYHRLYQMMINVDQNYAKNINCKMQHCCKKDERNSLILWLVSALSGKVNILIHIILWLSACSVLLIISKVMDAHYSCLH